MTSNTDKLKVVLDDLKNRVRVSESKIDLHSSILESQKDELNKLTERKDNTDNLKQSHLQFSENFNTTMKTIHQQIDINKSDMKEQLALQDDKRQELKASIDAKIKELNVKIETLTKMLEI